MKRKVKDTIGYVILAIGMACLLWEPMVRAVTKREPTFAAIYNYADWSDKETIILSGLHENDLVVYRVGHIDGWIDVWLENADTEPVTEVSTSGTTEYVVPERGLYVLKVEGDHANASVELSIYSAE